MHKVLTCERNRRRGTQLHSHEWGSFTVQAEGGDSLMRILMIRLDAHGSLRMMLCPSHSKDERIRLVRWTQQLARVEFHVLAEVGGLQRFPYGSSELLLQHALQLSDSGRHLSSQTCHLLYNDEKAYQRAVQVVATARCDPPQVLVLALAMSLQATSVGAQDDVHVFCQHGSRGGSGAVQREHGKHGLEHLAWLGDAQLVPTQKSAELAHQDVRS
mmetsp:Transcript_20622/g.48382  ORF Transcript_20622/g.48382 Transcript_20622/m.48382 type:complete len:215 (-) Transcript_20622:226-870(-)